MGEWPWTPADSSPRLAWRGNGPASFPGSPAAVCTRRTRPCTGDGGAATISRCIQRGRIPAMRTNERASERASEGWNRGIPGDVSPEPESWVHEPESLTRVPLQPQGATNVSIYVSSMSSNSSQQMRHREWSEGRPGCFRKSSMGKLKTPCGPSSSTLRSFIRAVYLSVVFKLPCGGRVE